MEFSTGLLLVSYGLMVLSNVLSQKGAFGPDNKVLSDSNPTYVTPDGKTFAVWGLIYLLETALVIAQLFPSPRTEELLAQRCPITGLDVRERISVAFMFNAIWLPVFSNSLFWTALAVMLAYLGFLLSAYSSVNTFTAKGPFEQVVYAAPIAANTSWIVVATMANLGFALRNAGWKDANGVGGTPAFAKAVVVLVVLLGAFQGLVSVDLAYAFVAGWVLSGINRMQTVPDKNRFPLASMNESLASWAQIGSYTVWGLAALGLVLDLAGHPVAKLIF